LLSIWPWFHTNRHSSLYLPKISPPNFLPSTLNKKIPLYSSGWRASSNFPFPLPASTALPCSKAKVNYFFVLLPIVQKGGRVDEHDYLTFSLHSPSQIKSSPKSDHCLWGLNLNGWHWHKHSPSLHIGTYLEMRSKNWKLRRLEHVVIPYPSAEYINKSKLHSFVHSRANICNT
jgi:hypothetical protein